MEQILHKNTFLVKEHAKILKRANNYDIYDPESNQLVMQCRENIGFLTKFFRFTDLKRTTPFDITISSADGQQIVRVKKSAGILNSNIMARNLPPLKKNGQA
jgi:hypothetical protein